MVGMDSNKFKKMIPRRKEIVLKRIVENPEPLKATSLVLVLLIECAVDNQATAVGDLAIQALNRLVLSSLDEFRVCLSQPRVDALIISTLERSQHLLTIEFVLVLARSRMRREVSPPLPDTAKQMIECCMDVVEKYPQTMSLHGHSTQIIGALLSDHSSDEIAVRVVDWTKRCFAQFANVSSVNLYFAFCMEILDIPLMRQRLCDPSVDFLNFVCNQVKRTGTTVTGAALCVCELLKHIPVSQMTSQQIASASDLLNACPPLNTAVCVYIKSAQSRLNTATLEDMLAVD